MPGPVQGGEGQSRARPPASPGGQPRQLCAWQRAPSHEGGGTHVPERVHGNPRAQAQHAGACAPASLPLPAQPGQCLCGRLLTVLTSEGQGRPAGFLFQRTGASSGLVLWAQGHVSRVRGQVREWGAGTQVQTSSGVDREPEDQGAPKLEPGRPGGPGGMGHRHSAGQGGPWVAAGRMASQKARARKARPAQPRWVS